MYLSGIQIWLSDFSVWAAIHSSTLPPHGYGYTESVMIIGTGSGITKPEFKFWPFCFAHFELMTLKKGSNLSWSYGLNKLSSPYNEWQFMSPKKKNSQVFGSLFIYYADKADAIFKCFVYSWKVKHYFKAGPCLQI